MADCLIFDTGACARHYGGLLLTSDPHDMLRLLEVIEGRPVRIVPV